MNDREQAIATLTEHLTHWKRLLSEGICTKDEGEKTIKALSFAIESIKVDRAYDLDYEKVDFIEIPEGATNGEVIEKVFPQLQGKIFSNNGFSYDIESNDGQVMVKCDGEWWDSPYRKEN